MHLSLQPSFLTFYAGDRCSFCLFSSNRAFSMLRCTPVSVSCSASYAMHANLMFPHLSKGVGAVCKEPDMGMLVTRLGDSLPNDRRLLPSHTGSARPRASATNACRNLTMCSAAAEIGARNSFARPGAFSPGQELFRPARIFGLVKGASWNVASGLNSESTAVPQRAPPWPPRSRLHP